MEIITNLKDIVVGMAAIATAAVAIRGLNNWNRELTGKVQFEVARGLIRATYKLRDAIADCRNPFIAGGEFPDDYRRDQNTPASENLRAWAHVYKNRWAPVWGALQEFDSLTLEAEALWGKDIRLQTDKLRQCVKELRLSIDMILSNEEDKETFGSDKEFGKKMKANAHSSPNNASNELSSSIDAAIAGIEDKVRFRLPQQK